jgi:hypothetical protein
MRNIDFQKIQISEPAMNFVLEPQNFSGKNSNSPINTAPASLCTAITYNVRYMRQVVQRYPRRPRFNFRDQTTG